MRSSRVGRIRDQESVVHRIGAWHIGVGVWYKPSGDEFYARYVWRTPIKADLDSTTATFGNEQYVYMQGKYEFVVTGTMKHYDQTAFLPKINVPVLTTTGEFDEVGPKTVEAHGKLIPGAKFVL